MHAMTYILLISAAHAQHAAASLVPLPGTILFSYSQGDFDGIIQVDALSGQYVGSLQPRINVQPAVSVGGLAIRNNIIYAAVSSATYSQFGVLEISSGEVSFLSSNSRRDIDAYGDGFIVGGNSNSRGYWDANLNFVSSIPLIYPPGFFIDNDFPATAAKSSGFVTSYYSNGRQIQHWDANGNYLYSEVFNNVYFAADIQAMDYDQATGNFWIAQGDILQYYEGFNPNPIWTIDTDVAGIGDIVYIPIPAPAGLCAVGAASILLLRRRR